MNDLVALFRAEVIKLRRSLILGLALLFPLGLLTVSLVVGLLSKPSPEETWRNWMTFTLFPWAFFLLPMLICLLAMLLLNLEHQNQQWKNLNSLPVRRWKHLAAKQLMLGALLLLAHLLLLVGFYLGGWALNRETPSLLLAAKLLGILFASSWAMLGIHTWLAARFSHLGVNLGLGITGVTLTMATSRWPEMARFYPWAMPGMGLFDWMGLDKSATPWLVVGVSLAMGTLLMGLACWDADWRESAG